MTAENESQQQAAVRAYRERIAAKGIKSESVKRYEITKGDTVTHKN